MPRLRQRLEQFDAEVGPHVVPCWGNRVQMFCPVQIQRVTGDVKLWHSILAWQVVRLCSLAARSITPVEDALRALMETVERQRREQQSLMLQQVRELGDDSTTRGGSVDEPGDEDSDGEQREGSDENESEEEGIDDSEEDEDDVEEGTDGNESEEVELKERSQRKRKLKRKRSRNAYIDAVLQDESDGEDYDDLEDWIAFKHGKSY